MADRTASAVWSGGLTDGSGSVSLDSSGLATFDVSWARRAEDPGGSTSPEELLAAAYASCYCMALSKAVADAGGSTAKFDASSTVSMVPGTGITKVALTVRAEVDGLDAGGFAAAAEAASQGCPVAGLFKGGSAEMTLDAALA
ncbi:MAG: OsmC family peroxiredoxin [Actinomycetota bacterium]